MSIGESLRAARHGARRSIADLSSATKLRSQLIVDIEHDDFSNCGGTVYARGHVRSLAAALYLDADPLLAEFDRTYGVLPDAPTVTDVFGDLDVVAVPHRTGPNWTGAMALAAAIALGLALVSVFNRPQTSSDLTAAPLPATAPTTAPPVVPPPVTGGPAVMALVPTNGVSVRVRVIARSWVSAKADGVTIFERVLEPEAVKDFRANREIQLVLGNAGGVTLVVNGRDIGSPGRRGQVVNLKFGPSDASGEPAAG